MSKSADKLIRKWDDPVLKAVCADVGPGEDLTALLETMEVACKRGTVKGVGLAAPQVGVSKRVIYTLVADDRGTVRGRFFVNPVLERRSEETAVEVEGCLSYPGKYKAIRRHAWVEVSYQRRPGGERLRERFHDYHARVIQHECEHLDGVCRVGDESEADSEFEARVEATAGKADLKRALRPGLVAAAIIALAGTDAG